MIYTFDRIKPLNIPKITVTPEYLAKGRLKREYNKTKLAFNVPWMGVVAMAFANYPNFYTTLWKLMLPLSKSKQFKDLCKDLVKISNRKSKELRPVSIIKSLNKLGYSNYEIKKIYKINQIFTKGNMPYLIMATTARILLEKGEILNRNKFIYNSYKGKVLDKDGLVLMEEHHADKNIQEVYKSIKANIGLPFINTDYRAFSRWPSYFLKSWSNFLPTLQSEEYEKKVLEIHNFIIKETLLLPNPNRISSEILINAANKDNKINEIIKVVKLFQWLLPGLVINVAYMREQITS